MKFNIKKCMALVLFAAFNLIVNIFPWTNNKNKNRITTIIQLGRNNILY